MVPALLFTFTLLLMATNGDQCHPAVYVAWRELIILHFYRS